MKVLVTGGSGLVGGFVAEELRRFHQIEILDLKTPPSGGLPHHRVDLLDAKGLLETVRGFDVVVHLAGIPHPLNDPAGAVFRTNALGTFNLLEACAENKIPRLIFISSESVLGFAFSTTRMWPLALPIDEQHPQRPQDPYGLSKVVSEELCRGFTRRTGMQTICLRPPWIWAPVEKEIPFYRRLRAEYENWSKNLWAYIHVFDVVKAVRLCVESTKLPDHDSYFITAAENWTDFESKTLAKEFFPEAGVLSENLEGRESFISSRKARDAFGFEPDYSWRDILH